MFYHVFNQTIKSNLELPELFKTDETCHYQWQISLCESIIASKDICQYGWIHQWYNPPIHVAQHNSTYIVHFPDSVYFCINPDNKHIHIKPINQFNPAVIRHLLLDQIIPRTFGQFGHLVLHASSALTNEGKCIVFLGDSGYGKSTIAAVCAEDGGNVLADDSVSIQFDDKKTIVIPSYSGLRVNQDTLQFLTSTSHDHTELGKYSKKIRLKPHNSNYTSDNNTYPVDAFFLLSPPNIKSCEQPHITPISVNDMDRLIGSLFLIDPTDSQNNIHLFKQITRVLQTNNHFNQLHYKRDFTQLSNLKQLVNSVWL